MIDGQTSDFQLAIELGMRVVKTGPDAYQYQKLNAAGKTIVVMPTHAHAYELWQQLIRVGLALGAALDEGKEDGPSGQKSPAPHVA